MNNLFQNAINSIELGTEDFQANDPKRALSAVRNFYAGTLLLAKVVLIRTVPDADPEDVIGAGYKPVPDGKGGVEFTASSERTIDFSEIGRRFKDFNLSIDQNALKDLSRIRNAIEHLYTDAPHDKVLEAIARAFPVVVDLFRLAGEQPHAVLGHSWQVMLDVRAVYDRELAQCRATFNHVDWNSSSMADAAIICPECQSHLVAHTNTTKTHREDANAQCRGCGAQISAVKLIETALQSHFEMECYVASTDGGEPPLFDCPECGVKAYIIFGDEAGCAWCGESLDTCLRCSTGLTPDNVSGDNSSLCSYCDNLMSKDD